MKWALVVACTLAASPAFADPDQAQPAPPAGACDDPGIAPRLTALLKTRRFADAHHAAVSLRVLCGPRDGDATWRLVDDIALLRLEDRPAALADLGELSRGSRASADVILAWAYLSDRDRASASTVLARLPAPRRAALLALAALDDEDDFASHARSLPAPLSTRALALGRDYHDARERSPAAAGIFSALVPGTGQLYAGSFEAAAITFALNALFIGATVELALDEHYATAAAAGTAASFFYVGGIINAVDLARRRNRVAQQPYADQLEQLLVPELSGDVSP